MRQTVPSRLSRTVNSMTRPEAAIARRQSASLRMALLLTAL
jgi:hypothetical protein